MQSKEQIIKTIKVIVMCVIVFILILVIYHYFINVRTRIVAPEKEKIGYSLSEVDPKYENPSYCEGGYFIVQENENDESNTIILDSKMRVIERFNLPKENIYCLYDNYYLINNNGNYTLKRNNSIIAGNIDITDITSQSNLIYHDAADRNAKYISYLYLISVIEGKRHFNFNNYAYAENGVNGLLINTQTGNAIDREVKSAQKVNLNHDTATYIYLKGSSNYLLDTVAEKKILNGYDLAFNDSYEDVLANSNSSLLVYRNSFGEGLISLDGNIIIPSNNQTIFLDSDNMHYFAVKKNGKYGLINSFGNETLNFKYDAIYVLDEFIITLENKKLIIYDSNLKQIGDTYTTVESAITLEKYSGFYLIKSVGENDPQVLVLTKTGEMHLLKGLVPILYGEYFAGKPCYLINDKGVFSIYVDNEHQYRLKTNFNNNVDHAIMLNNNRLYIDFPTNGKIRYDFYRINSGKSTDAFIKDSVDVTFKVMQVDKLIFSQENNQFSVYFNNELYDTFEADYLENLYGNYYLLKTADKAQFVKITQE